MSSSSVQNRIVVFLLQRFLALQRLPSFASLALAGWLADFLCVVPLLRAAAPCLDTWHTRQARRQASCILMRKVQWL